MTSIVFGRLLSNEPASIKLSPDEYREYLAAERYADKLCILRGAGLRAVPALIDMLLSVDGHLVTNLVAREPGPGEECVWIASRQWFSSLDTCDEPVVLGPEAVELLSHADHSTGPARRRRTGLR